MLLFSLFYDLHFAKIKSSNTSEIEREHKFIRFKFLRKFDFQMIVCVIFRIVGAHARREFQRLAL